MELLREWIMSLVAVSLLSALVRSLVGSGSLRRVAEFICALALLAALLRPLPGIRWEDLLPDTDEYAGSVERLQLQLEQKQDDRLAAGIAERTAAYISDKARCAVRVETKMENGVPLPWQAELERDYERELSDWIGETVGIPKERQAWHGGEN